MSWYVVGSGALAQPRFDLNWRKPKDQDIWSSSEEVVESLKNAQSIDAKLIPQYIIDLMDFEDIYATPDTVYTIKCSHLGWSNPMWSKHKADILHLKHLGCKLNKQLYYELVEFWKEELGSKDFLSLDKGKDDFFTDGVVYKYDHDWLHEQVAFPNRPVYEKCLVDGKNVLIDKAKFDKLSFEDQVRMFREEITVIAIERWMVNPKIKRPLSWVMAYFRSVEKTITSLTKNWATDFLVLNLEHFVSPDYKYFKHTLEELKLE